LEESIGQFISLLLITRYGEYRFDDSMGCKIWEYDFENAPFLNSRKAELEKAITEAIQQNEPRLAQARAKISLDGTNANDKASKRMRLAIGVTGVLIATNEPFSKPDYTIFFSPISTN
jgi:phage baseplate assembly protein W